MVPPFYGPYVCIITMRHINGIIIKALTFLEKSS